MGLFEKWRKKRKPSAPPMPASRGEMAGAEPRPPSLQGAITEALRSTKAPGLEADVMALGLVTGVRVREGQATITLSISNPDPEVRKKLGGMIKERVEQVPGVESAGIILMNQPPRDQAAGPAAGHRPLTPPAARGEGGSREGAGQPARPAAPDPFESQAPLRGIGRLVAVASGKGGVGKSSVALNLAAALSGQGRRVGLLDADIYGPSLAIMAGHREKPAATSEKKIEPVAKLGMKLMSMGFLVDPGEAVVWRGPMLMGALRQFLLDVDWGELDYLVVDLPPGTGDVQLSLAQITRVWGAVVVSTPQKVALADVRRCIRMFEKIDVPIVGLVENMSTFVCDDCGEATPIFGEGGAEREAEAVGVPFLGRIPLDPAVGEQADAGEPIVLARPEAPVSRAFVELAEAVHGARPANMGAAAR
ncbi:MAG: hypothetical protein CME06_10185 [Gemmatimonadetes bacterium]|nr:hypothetical protein [Gemmatimonadota bacterium]